MSEPAKEPIQAERWAWFLDVVFGAIVAVALEKFEPTLTEAWKSGFFDIGKCLFVAFAAFSFFVYDIAAYHILVNKYPYHVTNLGFVRFYLDLVLAFLLFMFLMAALAAVPERNTIGMVAFISLWHLGAMSWHFLARYEAGLSILTPTLIPHVVFVAIYWALLGAWYVVCNWWLKLNLPWDSVSLLFLISTTIFAISIWRWHQVTGNLTRKVTEPARKPELAVQPES
jgi:hypothetical protein